MSQHEPSDNETVGVNHARQKRKREALGKLASALTVGNLKSMDRVEHYLDLAESRNTKRSYAAAVRHFELEWHGLLPATPETVARYLADYAAALSVNTLKSRLAGLSRWHLDHGFADPTKSPYVARVLKGIRAAHNAAEKQARPVELLLLQQVSSWLEQQITHSMSDPTAPNGLSLRRTRDQAMLLLGFWRGFRSDELTRLRVENIVVEPGIGLTCYLPHSKGDRESAGRTFRCPSLTTLCPVAAYERWIDLSGITAGAVFRRIDRWGHLAEDGLSAGSVVPWLRLLFSNAGVAAPTTYSSHSLRRGFAGWAQSSGWDIKELMEYVGWRDMASALRYLEAPAHRLQARFEEGLESVRTKNAPDSPTQKRIVANRQNSPLRRIK